MQLEAIINYSREVGLKLNYSELERKYGVNRKKIKKMHLGEKDIPKTRNRKSHLDQYRDLIIDKLSIPGVTMAGIYRYLSSNFEIKVTYNTMKHYIWKNKLKDSVKKKEVMRFETEFGHQAQVDWKENIKLISKHGEVFVVNVFAMILSASRRKYFELTLSKNQYVLKNCIVNAFEFFGGVPTEVLFDNMRTVADINDGKKRVNRKFLSFAEDLGFITKLCKVRRPQTKGKVESQMKFLDDLKIYNNEFESFDDLKVIVNNLQYTVNNQVSQAHNQIPNLVYLKEKEYLKPLNMKFARTLKSNLNTHKVSNECLISFKGNKYSVPIKFINKRVFIEPVNDELYIYYNTSLIAIHQLSNNKINYQKNHYTDIVRTYDSFDDDYVDNIVTNNLLNFDRIGEK
jgi:transposase